ncbi:MAG: gliding motility-associated ABC transporter substrate-binding protein GldG [Bacteroidota bacterium]
MDIAPKKIKKRSSTPSSQGWLWLLGIGLGCISWLQSGFFARLDLTQDKRYTIHPATQKCLYNLTGDVHIDLYLAGPLPTAGKQLQRATRALLDEYTFYAKYPLHCQWIDIHTLPAEEREMHVHRLQQHAIAPTQLCVQTHGQRTEHLIYPGAIIRYQGRETGVLLLKSSKMAPADQMIGQSIDNLAYTFTAALHLLATQDPPQVAIIQGHAEPPPIQRHGLTQALSKRYQLHETTLTSTADLAKYQALFCIKPQRPFAEEEKYVLDQYIMQGGKVLFLLDRVHIHKDSLSSGGPFAFPLDLNIDDQLFRYGVRINPDLIQDLQAGVYPIVAGRLGNQPQLRLVPWLFFPILNNFAEHLITQNKDALYTQFVSSIDPVTTPGVTHTPLVFTSPHSRKVDTPVHVDIASLNQAPNPALYNQGPIPVVYLLTGTFTSLYQNRLIPPAFDTAQFMPISQPTQLLVAATGSLVLNAVHPRKGQAYPWGYDPFSQETFANEDFILDVLAYMLDDTGLLHTQRKAYTIRPLDIAKVEKDRFFYQLINILAPLACLLLIGLAWRSVHKRIFCHFYPKLATKT